MNIRPRFKTPYSLRKKPLPCGVWLGCHLGALLWLAPAHARIAIHVRGASEFEGAAVTPLTGGELQIQGLLKDELGAPIAGAKLQLAAVGQGHEVTPLTALKTCNRESLATRGNDAPPPETGASATFTAPDGSFCVRLTASAITPGCSVQLRYEGTEDYEGTQRLLAPADRRLALSGRFDTLPHNISLDESVTTFTVSITPLFEPQLAEPLTLPVELALLDASSQQARKLQQFTTKVGERTTLTLPRETLGPPGPAELVLSFDGNDQIRPLRLIRRFMRTVNVSLRPLELPTRVTAGDTLRVGCTVSSHLGQVTSGSVELTANGIHQALRPVSKDGEAAFVFATQKNQSKLLLAFSYQPAQEGFVATRPEIVTLELTPPSPWRFTGWVIAGLLVLGWFGWSRRLPPKVREEPKAIVPQPPRAHIEVLGPTSGETVGWEGLVVDAHEGQPLGSVRIAVVQQGFGRSTVLFEIHSDKEGAFSIPRNVVPKGTYCELVVETVAYATFTTELPPPGLVRLYLVSVRRAILDRLVVWAKRRGVPFRSKSEPTPDWVAQVAHQRGNRDIEQWAQAVSAAAFGNEPPKNAQSPDLQPPTGPDVCPIPHKPSES